MQRLAITARNVISMLWKPLVILALILVALNLAKAASRWHEIAPGIEYLDLSKKSLSPWASIHAFKINLTKNELSLSLAKDFKRPYASADEFGRQQQAMLAINGGFFDEGHRPLGLRISQYRQLSPLKPISWWGVFYIKNNRAHISSYRQFKKSNAIQFAVQSGPRLIVNGTIPSLKPGVAERSALCITRKGQVVILATEHAAMTTTELAHIMKAPPLNCVDALNLDGGKSTQLYASVNNLQLSVHGFSKVSDAILVHPGN